MILRPGSDVQVVSTKYDGSHHHRYTLTVESVEPGRLLAFAPAGNPLDSHRGRYGAGTRFGYLPDLVARAWRAVDEVRGLIDRRQEPFDGRLYAWRPTSSSWERGSRD